MAGAAQETFYETGPGKLPLDPIWLHFSGDEAGLEGSYAEYEKDRNLSHLRLAALVAAFLCGIFYLFDFFVAPAHAAAFAIVRFAVVCPIFLVILGASYHPVVQRFAIHLQILCVLIASGGHIIMGLLAPNEVHFVYSLALLVCLIFNYNFIRLPFMHAFATGTFVCAVYFLVQIQWGTLRETQTIIYLMSFLGIQPILATICYTAERKNRRNFYLMQLLSRQHRKKESVNLKLEEALGQVKLLGGLLPICAACKKIRDDKGYWNQIEVYISEHSEARFSHGICPSCVARLYPEIAENEA